MSHSFRPARTAGRVRVPLCAVLIVSLVGCDSTSPLNPDSSTGPAAVQVAPAQEASLPTASLATPSLAGGIPMGTYALPTTWFGARYNGGMRTLGPYGLRTELAAIKARGGKIVLMLAGSDWNYLDADGRFSLSMWKQRIDRFRGIDFASYVNDGTIIAHYLIDEPYDPTNWGGRIVPGSTLDEMAKYSKSIWPNMTTIVRAEPVQIKWNGTYHYLDAAWAQYLVRKGDVNDYIRRNVSDAQSMGLGLVVGLNLLDGGTKNAHMTAAQVETFGSTLLSSTYPCAFISWQYSSTYLNSSGIGSAMDVLRRKAESRSSKACRA
jgi:hypothetical protein